MAQVITTAGEQLFAIKAQNNQPLDIDTFIFAYVPGQDSSAAIDRNEGLPPVGQRVHQQIVQQRGRVNSNVVIYSTVLDSVTGPFEFNWVGLYSSVNNTLVAISKIPTVVKTVTVPGTAGNILNRNFGIEYSGIADLDGITVDPETWQLDYTARLNGMDELTRQLAADMNGRDWFIDNGFKVEPLPTPNNFKVTAGAGYVSGLRIAIEEEPTLIAASYPQFVYVNAWFDGTSEATWKGQTTFQITPAEQEDYTDETGKRHYLFKLATITAANTVIDHRSGRATSPHAGIKYLLKVPGIKQTTLSFHTGLGVGGGDYIWLPNADQSQHLKRGPNGGILWSAAALDLYDGTKETLAALLSWVGVGYGCFELVGLEQITPEHFGGVPDYNYTTQNGTDNRYAMQAAFTYMSENKIKLTSSGGDYYCSYPPKANGWAEVDLKAATIILADSDSWGVEFENNHEMLGSWSEPGTDTGLGLLMQYIKVTNPEKYIRGMRVLVRDPNAIYNIAEANAKRAMQFTVADKIGEKIYLDTFFVDAMVSGECYLLPYTKCNIALDVRGQNPLAPNPLRRAAICLKGYPKYEADVYVHDDASRGFMPVSSTGEGKVVGYNLADNADIGHYGYAACPYGASRGNNLVIWASKCRHAYTDGIYPLAGSYITDGHAEGNKVTFVAESCTSAAGDTHAFSNNTLFVDCHISGTHQDTLQNNTGTNYAYQLRGTNAKIQGGTADTERLLNYLVAANRIRKSDDLIENVKTKFGRENLNFNIQVYGPSEFSQANGYNQQHKLTIKGINVKDTNHRVGGIRFVYHEDCIIDAGDRAPMQNDTIGDAVDPVSGLSVRTAQRYKNCEFISGDNFRIYSGDVYLDNTKINKPEGDGSGQNWSIRGNNVVIYANNVGYMADAVNGSSIWEFGSPELAIGAQPTGCKLYHSNNWGARRTGAMPLKLVANYADENNIAYLEVIDMEHFPMTASASDMPIASVKGERVFVTQLNFSPEWDGFKWVINGYRCIGVTANRPSNQVWNGFKYYDTTIGSVVEWDGEAWA